MGLDSRSLELLELPAVLAGVAEHAATPMGRERVLTLQPSCQLQTVLALQAETSQARRLLELGGEAARPPLDVPDVREAVRRAGAGATLSGRELVAIARACGELVRLGAYLRRWAVADGAVAPVLARRLPDLPEREAPGDAILQALAEDGSVQDRASPALANIRTRLRRAEAAVQERLQALLRSPVGRRALQEPIVTLREGRYVVPVRQEARDQVPGIVHDASATGATLYVEPFSVVEANNTVRALQAMEAREVERILAELSHEVGRAAGHLLRALAAAGELDAIVARARHSLESGSVEPVVNGEGRVRLLQARHPLLGARAVPIDVEIGTRWNVLVVSGPNTGGKTVAMKTIGLLCAMAMSGLHVPAAPGSETAVFDEIWADVGDQQSLAENLSTFSSHLRRIIPILGQATPRSLVLLDELGAGTDPEEGGALACAILRHLLAAGARAVVTTHLGDVKLMAHTTPGMANASVAFDLATLEPTYRLVTGSPGPSHALAIAARLGMPPLVVEGARRHLGPERLGVEALIGQLQRSLEEADRRLHRAVEDQRAAEAARQEAERLLRELHASRRRTVERAREQADELLRDLRRQVETLLEQLKEAARREQTEQVRRARARLTHLRARAEEALAHLEQAPPPSGPGRPAASMDGGAGAPAGVRVSETPQPLQVGQKVWVEPLAMVGEVVELAGQEEAVWIQVGAARTRLSRQSVTLVPQEQQAAAPSPAGHESIGVLGISRAASLPSELDLRGLTVDEALARLDKYLDDCVLAGVQGVRVVHGHGTGALRQAVRSYLRRARAVRAFTPAPADQGGDGATLVELG